MKWRTEQQAGRNDGGSVGEVLGFSLRITRELYGYNSNSKDAETQSKPNLKGRRQEPKLRLEDGVTFPRIPVRLLSVAHGRKAWQAGSCATPYSAKPLTGLRKPELPVIDQWLDSRVPGEHFLYVCFQGSVTNMVVAHKYNPKIMATGKSFWRVGRSFYMWRNSIID